jgi:hypothetical protein
MYSQKNAKDKNNEIKLKMKVISFLFPVLGKQ